MPMQAKIKGHAYDNDITYEFSGLLREEMFYGKNISLLNDFNCFDSILYWRHILDLSLDVVYGQEKCGTKVLELFGTMRNRGVWGNPRSISSTTQTSVKLSETIFGAHDHGIPRHILWIRELWMQMDIGEIFHVSFPTKQTFTLGAFKFELGRGIALGSAYATGHQLLGFYSEDIIDQYAFGGKISGDILEKKLSYDLYSAILQNRSSTISDTAEHVYGQEYGHLNYPERGFGKIAFLFAGRLFGTLLNSKSSGKLTLEPYFLYANDPEQRIDFVGDASSVLGTLGLASEYDGERFAVGFDYAKNLGFQNVKGWDRNTVKINNSDSNLVEINSHVEYKNPNNANDPQNGKKIPYMRGQAQDIINNAIQSEEDNGQLIGIVDKKVGSLDKPVYLANTKNRFRNPYVNKFTGWMFVADGALKTPDNSLQLAAAIGFASGGINPNRDIKFKNRDNQENTYSGFIGVQEIYCGKRVRSAFLLGSAGKVKRPLALPASKTLGSTASSTTNFTNVRFTGVSLTKTKEWPCDRKFVLNPNILCYWQDEPSPVFSVITKKDLNADADQFLGTELNVFMDYYALKNFRVFFVVSMFIPGSHFYDIQGKPITDAQVRALDRRDRSGYNGEAIPNIGYNVAATYNFGFEYTF
jgi:hypothetical protein